MWAFICGAVSSGNLTSDKSGILFLGIVLCGPLVCGMSQAANDWCDRHVDIINEPNRPIPSGRMPGKWGLWIAIIMTIISITLGFLMGIWCFVATLIAVVFAWLYSLEPIRLKRSGILGPLAVGICYEGIPWFTGVAIITQSFPNEKTIFLAALYGFGAYGIMVLNDYKALKGDKQTGIKSLPLLIGVKNSIILSCFVILISQILVSIFLNFWQLTEYSLLVGLLTLIQFFLMFKLYKNPSKFAPWYNKTGVLAFITGMMISAVGVGGIL
tara:strand:- start:62 stop:871 length:810 start_codon:yes stop_codon:yes gene_type:complete